MFEVWGADHPWTDNAGNSHETFNTFVTGAAQYWLTDIVWIKGGLGLAVPRTIDSSYAYDQLQRRLSPPTADSGSSAPLASR